MLHTVQPWCNEGPRDCQILFAITWFRYIEVLSCHIFCHYWTKEKRLSEDFVIWRFVILRFHCIIFLKSSRTNFFKLTALHNRNTPSRRRIQRVSSRVPSPRKNACLGESYKHLKHLMFDRGRISSFGRALGCRAGGGGFNSRGRTNTQGLNLKNWEMKVKPLPFRWLDLRVARMTT